MAGGEGYFYDGDARLLLMKFDAGLSTSSTVEIVGWQALGRCGQDGDTRRAVLGRNRPNPFSAGTSIPYTIGQEGPVTLEVFSPLGRKVATLVHEVIPPGEHIATWNGINMLGRRSSPGVYFCRLEASGRSETGKLVLLR